MTQVTVSKTGIAAEMDALAKAIEAKCCLDLLDKALESQNKADKTRKEWILGIHNAGMTSVDLADNKRPERNIIHAQFGLKRLTGREALLYKISTADAKDMPETDKDLRAKLRKRGDTFIRDVIAELKVLEDPTLASDTGNGANSSGKEKYDLVTIAMAAVHTVERRLDEQRQKDEGLDNTGNALLAAFTQLKDTLRADNPVLKSAFDKFSRGELIGKVSVTKKK